MDQAVIIEANPLAASICASAKAQLRGPCGLALILVSDDPYAQRMLDLKIKQAKAVGITSIERRFDGAANLEQVVTEIERLNRNPAVHGIFVQAPLPDHMNASAVFSAIDPAKDVDGYHPLNLGRLALGAVGFVPCAALGGVMLLKNCVGPLNGKRAVVVGRSNTLGKPVAHLLVRDNCTVTIAHSKTHDLSSILRQADIVVAAIGQLNFIIGEWIKPGAAVLDMGANLVEGALVGDVEFESVVKVADFLNRPTNAVGPMTVALLLAQTVSVAMTGLPLD